MRRPKPQPSQMGDRSPICDLGKAPEVFAALQNGKIIPLNDDTFRQQLRTAFHAGLKIDNESEAAADAFRALTAYNHREAVHAVELATKAARANARAWMPLLEAFLGTTPQFEEVQ